MIKFSLVLFQTCTTTLIISQLLVPILAIKKTSNVDEFMVENQRTRMRQNYVMQRALNNDMDHGEIGVTYVSKYVEPNTNPEQLPAFIMNYDKLRSKDSIILLDNSVETRTRKRGNIKVHEINDLPCSCEEEGTEPEILGDDYFPSVVEHRICNEKRCPAPYGCKRRTVNYTILKRRDFTESISSELPEELQKIWVSVKLPVTVGCMCSRYKSY